MLRLDTRSTSPRCWIIVNKMSSRSYNNGSLSRTFSNCSATDWLFCICAIYFSPFGNEFGDASRLPSTACEIDARNRNNRRFLNEISPCRSCEGCRRGPHGGGVSPRSTLVLMPKCCKYCQNVTLALYRSHGGNAKIHHYRSQLRGALAAAAFKLRWGRWEI